MTFPEQDRVVLFLRNLEKLIILPKTDFYGQSFRPYKSLNPKQEKVKEILDDLKKLAEYISRVPREIISDNGSLELEKVNSIFDDLFKLQTEISNISETIIENSPSRLNQQFDAFIAIAMKLCDELEYLKIRFRFIEQNRILSKDNELFKLISKSISSIDRYENKAKKVTKNIENLSVEFASNVKANFFNESYNNYSTQNVLWLSVIIFLVSVLIEGTVKFNEWYSFSLPLRFQLTNPQIAIEYEFYLFLISKISFVLVIIMAIYFSMKNFNANKHNAVINKHRADSLLTYKSIIDVAGMDKQDIILTQISECMFKHQDTGFGKLDDSGPSWEQVINLLTKTVGKSKEGG